MKKINLKFTIILSVIIIGLISCDKEDLDDNKNSITLSGYTILQMSFIDADEGWLLVAVNGGNNEYKIIHSADGFENYTVVNETSPRFRKMEFIDSDNGIAISWDGADKTYYTNDGGASWNKFEVPAASQEGSASYDITYNSTYFVMPYHVEGSDYRMRIGVRFFNRSDFQFHHKTVFENPAAALHGGGSGSDQHYSSVHLSETGAMSFTGVYQQVDAIFDVDSTFTAYAIDETTLSLSLLTNEKKSPERTEFISDEVGYFSLKDDASLYKTDDEGHTWSVVYTFDNANSYIKVDFADENNGAVLNGNTLYLTNDGGQTFHQSSSIDNTYHFVEELVYINSNNIYLSVIDVTDGITTQKLIKIED